MRQKYNIIIITFLVFALNAIPWYLLKIKSGRKIFLIGLVSLFLLPQIFLNKKIEHRFVQNIKSLTPIILFIVAAIFTLFYTPAPKYGAYKIILLLIHIPIIFFLTTNISNFKKIEFFRKGILVACLITVFSLLINKFINPQLALPRLGIQGKEGVLYAGRLLGLGILASLSYYLRATRKYTMIKWLLVAALFLGFIFLTGTRQAFISLFITIALILILPLFYKRKKFILKKIIPIFIILVISVFIIGKTTIFKDYLGISRYYRIIKNPELIAQEKRLTQYYPPAIDLFKKHPIIGGGIGSYAIHLRNEDTRIYPHNIFLETISEMGIIGISIFVFIIFLTFWKINRLLKYYLERRYATILIWLSGTWIYTLGNACFTGDFSTNLHFWILVAIILSLKINHLE